LLDGKEGVDGSSPSEGLKYLQIQAVNILNQTRLFAVDPAARSRLNTAFVGSNFIGGAIGSTLAGILWQLDRWSIVTLVCALLLLLALIVWMAQRSTRAIR
jgi:predicted MFS family arabinose efflux permease